MSELPVVRTRDERTEEKEEEEIIFGMIHSSTLRCGDWDWWPESW